MALSTFASIARSGLLTTANCAGSAVVNNLVSTGYSYLCDFMLPGDIEAKLKRLKKALPYIKDIMGIVEALKMKEPSVDLWVHQFRQAVEASKDVLDELEYKRLEDMVKDQGEAGGSTSSSKKRKFSALNNDTLEGLKEAIILLDQASAKTQHLLQVASLVGFCYPSELQQEANIALRRETTSFLAVKEVFGREVEKAKIIGWLNQPTDAPLSSFDIVGVGGQGKTTLVQFAYQEILKENQFNKTIWVCVSTNFSVEDVTRKMLGETSCGKPLNVLQETLKEMILSKKVLIILDDVWDDKRWWDWEKLFAPFRFVQRGSKILFTTRMKSVAEMLAKVINTEHEYLALEGLGEQVLRMLFNSYAFRGLNPDNHRDLLEFENQILKLLRGNPLAAKVIGSLLNSCMDNQSWRRILNKSSIFNMELAKDMVEVLKLSYYHLPADLQVCFRFCSIFPQGHKFDKNELIKMWIASAFIREQSDQEERPEKEESPEKGKPEDIGEHYFNLLLSKSFFEHYNDMWEGERYVIHDMMHELAQNVSYGECCRIEPTDKCLKISETVRHVSVHESKIEEVSHLENIRSLVITTFLDETATSPNIFVLPKNLIKKSLRLLRIEGYRNCELPEEISQLVHLRYLSIEAYVTQPFKYLLQSSIYKLYHLQVLKLLIHGNNPSYSGIETTGMTNLRSLRYLSLPEEILQTIHDVHKLTSLQELTFFIGREICYGIDELGRLKNLRHLSIKKIENVGDLAEATRAKLSEKNNLISLYLEWTLWSNPNNPEQIIDSLRPNSNLKELTIVNYKGQRSPIWMEKLPPLELSSLKLNNCPIWNNQLFSWKMPYLKILDICDCPKLEKLPHMPLSLIEFRIDNVGLISLPELYQSYGNNTLASLPLKSSLKIVEIRSCPNLISLNNGFLQQDNLDLQATEKLIICGCERLVDLPNHGFGNLASLIELSLTECPKLVATDFRGYRQLTKLQHLIMENCGAIVVPLLEALSDLTTLNVMKITNCRNLSRLPSLPLSLTTFCIDNVAVSDLPQYYQSSDSSDGQSTSSLKSSLRELAIINCPKLRSLKGFLQQENIVFQTIEDIVVSNCRNLVNVPVGGFGKFLSLRKLTIRDCPMLAAVDNQSNLLPVELKFLEMKNCGELDVPLLESASTLNSLTDLWLNNCANISRIPSSENAFRSLNELHIFRCKNLVEHDANRWHSMDEIGDVDLSLSLRLLKITSSDDT